MIAVDHCSVPGACGVGVVYEFEDVGTRRKSHWGDVYTKATDCNKGGAGWICGGFLENDPVCDTVFEEMSAKYNLVFRTPTRINKNSGNPFYFAVFDTEGVNIPQGFDETGDM